MAELRFGCMCLPRMETKQGRNIGVRRFEQMVNWYLQHNVGAANCKMALDLGSFPS